MSWPEESPGVSVRASWKPQPQPEQATSSLGLSPLFRNVWFFSSAASPNHHSVREQCGADPRWHSCGIVCSPGWCVTVAPLASSIVMPLSVQSAGCVLLFSTDEWRWHVSGPYCRAEGVNEAGPILILQSDFTELLLCPWRGHCLPEPVVSLSFILFVFFLPLIFHFEPG